MRLWPLIEERRPGGGKLDGNRAIGDKQGDRDPDDLHRRQPALPHRDRAPGRAAHLHHPPAGGRVDRPRRPRPHRGRQLPGRAAAADDRHPSLPSSEHPGAGTSGHGGPVHGHPHQRAAGRLRRSRGRLHREGAGAPPGHHVQRRRDPARARHGARQGAAGVHLPARRRPGHRPGPAGVHALHPHHAGPVPPRAGRHPADPYRGLPLGARPRRLHGRRARLRRRRARGRGPGVTGARPALRSAGRAARPDGRRAQPVPRAGDQSPPRQVASWRPVPASAGLVRNAGRTPTRRAANSPAANCRAPTCPAANCRAASSPAATCRGVKCRAPTCRAASSPEAGCPTAPRPAASR